MERRDKPSFKDEVSNPERATNNVFMRDMLLAEQVRAQAQSHGLAVLEVDGALSVEKMAALVEAHLEPLLRRANGKMPRAATIEDSKATGA